MWNLYDIGSHDAGATSDLNATAQSNSMDSRGIEYTSGNSGALPPEGSIVTPRGTLPAPSQASSKSSVEALRSKPGLKHCSPTLVPGSIQGAINMDFTAAWITKVCVD